MVVGKELGSRDRYERKKSYSPHIGSIPIVILLRLSLTNKMAGNSHFKYVLSFKAITLKFQSSIELVIL